jgi:hypothetical protein
MTGHFNVNVTASISGHSIGSFQRIALPGEDSQSIVRIKELELTLHRLESPPTACDQAPMSSQSVLLMSFFVVWRLPQAYPGPAAVLIDELHTGLC